MRKHYIKPETEVVKLQQQCHLLAGSVDPNGMNTGLQNEEVDGGW